MDKNAMFNMVKLNMVMFEAEKVIILWKFGRRILTLFILLCVAGMFLLLMDPTTVSIFHHLQQALGIKHSPLYSIDTIFQDRWIKLTKHPHMFQNNTPHGHIIRQYAFQKDWTKIFGPKSSSTSDEYVHTILHWNVSSLSSPYVLPSDLADERRVFTNQRLSAERSKINKQTKLIAFYNKPSWLGLDFTFDLCVIPECQMVGTSKAYQADAVVFSAPDLTQLHPPPRPHGQRWVYYNLESPPHTSNVTSSAEWRHQFNLTMTYRTDSDIFLPYAYFQEAYHPSAKNYENIAGSKSRLVALFMSNCNTTSKRLDYVTELQKYIPVDVYGKCGPFDCYSRHHKDCLDILDAKYKFYLSFENSFCVDYMTEKFTKIFRGIDVVPIVRGGAQYKKGISNSQMVPYDVGGGRDRIASRTVSAVHP